MFRESDSRSQDANTADSDDGAVTFTLPIDVFRLALSPRANWQSARANH